MWVIRTEYISMNRKYRFTSSQYFTAISPHHAFNYNNKTHSYFLKTEKYRLNFNTTSQKKTFNFTHNWFFSNQTFEFSYYFIMSMLQWWHIRNENIFGDKKMHYVINVSFFPEIRIWLLTQSFHTTCQKYKVKQCNFNTHKCIKNVNMYIPQAAHWLSDFNYVKAKSGT